MKKRLKINVEAIMEKISIVATILMGVVSVYHCFIDLRQNCKKLVNRGDGEGS